MQAKPQPVDNVTIHPYLPDQPIEVPPVFVDGAGTYGVGTLTTNIFYNLNLTAGKPQHGGVVAGSKYYAVGKYKDGTPFQSPWMSCLQGGDTPKFGRTISMVHTGGDAAGSADIAYQVHLTEVSVDLYINPHEPLVVPLIKDGKGLATFVGLLPGGTWSVVVSGGERVNPLHAGARVSISGKNVSGGKAFNVPAVLVCEDDGEPATFRQL